MKQFDELGLERLDVCNILVKYLFHSKNSRRKNVFWMCFGDIVLENLKRNIPDGSIQCKKCGERFVPLSPQQKVCTSCSGYHPLGKKKLRCIDCGKEFEVDGVVKIRSAAMTVRLSIFAIMSVRRNDVSVASHDVVRN